MRHAAIALVAASVLAYSAPAQAGVVSTFYDGERLVFLGASGEVNALTVMYATTDATGSGETTVSDAGAPLRVGAGCRAVSPETAVCARPAGPVWDDWFDLRDRADSAAFAGVAAELELFVAGDAGADNLSTAGLVTASLVYVAGNGGDDVLMGGRLGENFAGGWGDDAIVAGAGNDLLDGESGDDRLDGGSGRDDLQFLSASRGVVVNLARGQATTTQGRDTLSSIEVVWGTEFADVLIGDAARNRLIGDLGADRLHGGSGDDRLEGHLGADLLFGGAGRDRLQGELGRDVLRGGTGTDRLFGGWGDDVLAARDGRLDHVRGGRGRDCASADRIDDVRDVEARRCGPTGPVLSGRPRFM